MANKIDDAEYQPTEIILPNGKQFSIKELLARSYVNRKGWIARGGKWTTSRPATYNKARKYTQEQMDYCLKNTAKAIRLHFGVDEKKAYAMRAYAQKYGRRE